MRYRFISDSHIHSDCSFDGNDSVMMLSERAAALGYYSITVTDHCECDVYYKDSYDKTVEQSFFETRKAKAVFRDRLAVFNGIELGQPLYDLGAAEDALSKCDFDFVLGSVHNLRDKKDFYYLNYNEENVPALLNAYFDELISLSQWSGIDSLAHLTYPLRYIVGGYQITVNLKNYWDKIETILKNLAKNGKALEVNTSGLRQVIGVTMPDFDVVARFKELGGRYVTLGSDAHRWADVGSCIEDGLMLLRKAGFNHFTVYEKRRPVLLPIE